MPHSGPHFSIFWCVFIPKCSILAPPWRPAGLQMGPQIAQVAPKGRHFHLYGDAFFRIHFRDRFRRAPGHRFHRFWMDLGWIFMNFGWIWDEFSWNSVSLFCCFFGPEWSPLNHQPNISRARTVSGPLNCFATFNKFLSMSNNVHLRNIFLETTFCTNPRSAMTRRRKHLDQEKTKFPRRYPLFWRLGMARLWRA